MLRFKVETQQELGGWVESLHGHAAYGLAELRAAVAARTTSAMPDAPSDGGAAPVSRDDGQESQAMARVAAASPKRKATAAPASKPTPTSVIDELDEVSYWLSEGRRSQTESFSENSAVEYAKSQARASPLSARTRATSGEGP